MYLAILVLGSGHPGYHIGRASLALLIPLLRSFKLQAPFLNPRLPRPVPFEDGSKLTSHWLPSRFSLLRLPLNPSCTSRNAPLQPLRSDFDTQIPSPPPCLPFPRIPIHNPLDSSNPNATPTTPRLHELLHLSVLSHLVEVQARAAVKLFEMYSD